MTRIAVVLFNLGGPDGPEAVRPFLYNLFNDPAIITLPAPFRSLLAQFLSRRRTPEATAIYERMGGSSPLLPNTEDQARALADLLAGSGEARIFIAMRYWRPRAEEAVRAVKAFAPDLVALLPLYPQFSTTTTASSLREWYVLAERHGLEAPTRTLCCYPTLPGFINACADMVIPAIREAREAAPVRVLLSAHGLPERIVRNGDPYQWQVEQSAAALAQAVRAQAPDLGEVDWRVTYQSRATPEAWLKPDTEDEVKLAGSERRALVVVPIAFVSEHSETLVELDIEYAELAVRSGVPRYVRVPTVKAQPMFVAGLAELVRRLMVADKPVCSQFGTRLCPAGFSGCPNARR
ncbi:MAG: ferrochelatase [Alphaproteobacteria bacterium]